MIKIAYYERSIGELTLPISGENRILKYIYRLDLPQKQKISNPPVQFEKRVFQLIYETVSAYC